MKRWSSVISVCACFAMMALPLSALADGNPFSSVAPSVNANTPLYGQTSCGGGSAGGGTTTITLTGSDIKEKIFNYFVAKGLSAAASAGIDGNFGAESSWDPSDSGGYLAQWGGVRLTALGAFAAKEGKPVTDLGIQLDYAWLELTNGTGSGSDKSAVLQQLRGATSPENAADIFMGPPAASPGFEDPLVGPTEHQPLRESYARQIYDQNGGGSGGGSAGGGGTTTVCGGGNGGGSPNCSSATGNAKIFCEAEAYAGIYYEYGGGHQGYKSFIQGCPDPSNPPDNQPTGGPINGDPAGLSGNPSPCGLDCSALVSVAVDAAFNQTFMWTSEDIRSDANWQSIDPATVQPGDVVEPSADHVAIVDHYDPSTGLVQVFQAHQTGEKIGSYTNPLSDYHNAYRYVGPTN